MTLTPHPWKRTWFLSYTLNSVKAYYKMLRKLLLLVSDFEKVFSKNKKSDFEESCIIVRG